MFRVFTLFYPSTSPNASFKLISFFVHSLTKAPDNNTPATKIPPVSVSLELSCLLRILLQLHFGVVADRFLLLQQVAQKSPQQKSACVIRVASANAKC